MTGQWSKKYNQSYDVNRKFTDFVHKNIAIPTAYKILEWEERNCDSEILDKVDKDCGIDYFFTDVNGKVISVQERFRSVDYLKYNDFTITYKRGDDNTYMHHYGELFKIRADFMLYGITNGTILNHEKDCTKFEKIVLINIQNLLQEFRNGRICLSDSEIKSNCRLIARVVHRKDAPSFIAFDVPKLLDEFASSIVIQQFGYL